MSQTRGCGGITVNNTAPLHFKNSHKSYNSDYKTPWAMNTIQSSLVPDTRSYDKRLGSLQNEEAALVTPSSLPALGSAKSELSWPRIS